MTPVKFLSTIHWKPFLTVCLCLDIVSPYLGTREMLPGKISPVAAWLVASDPFALGVAPGYGRSLERPPSDPVFDAIPGFPTRYHLTTTTPHFIAQSKDA
jgi:hypothetical protein